MYCVHYTAYFSEPFKVGTFEPGKYLGFRECQRSTDLEMTVMSKVSGFRVLLCRELCYEYYVYPQFLVTCSYNVLRKRGT